MKPLPTLLLVAGLAFYGGWPLYSGYSIKSALDTEDRDALSAKIDFPSVRESMRPAVTEKVEKTLAAAMKKSASGGSVLAEALSAKVAPKVTEHVLAVLVTPASLIRVYSDGGRFKDSIDRLISDQVTASVAGGGLNGVPGPNTGTGGDGGLLGDFGKIAEKLGFDPKKALGGLSGSTQTKAPETTDARAGKKPSYGFDNIKHFGLDGPLALSLGLAKDPAQKDADLTAVMSFVENDWKLTGLIPKL